MSSPLALSSPENRDVEICPATNENMSSDAQMIQCDLCTKSFKPHACDVCGLALMTQSQLERHKRVHSGENRHECPVCGKRFSERYNLAAHAKMHEASAAVAPLQRRKLFRCTFCPDRFERRYMLEHHISSEHDRALESSPPTPRNTMSKLLKAEAKRHAGTDDSDGDEDTVQAGPSSAPSNYLNEFAASLAREDDIPE